MFQCTPMVLPPAATLRRESVRPVEFRSPGFEEEFDGETLFYDVIRLDKQQENALVLLGPPLLNLFPSFSAGQIGSRRLSSRISQYYLRDRCCDVWIPGWTSDTVQFRFEFGTYSLSSQLAANHLYAGKRVLYTLSRDNELRWIIDWIRFHVRNHGANAVLLYDNASTRYSGEGLERSLRQAFPQLVVNVVQWPYKYGPQGLSRDSGWDSDFCQAVAFHDARFRFLNRSSSVLNCDIDELVVSSNGESIFEATEKARKGCLVFGGHWISNAIDERRDKLNSPPDVRHSYFKYSERSTLDPCPNKWCVVPSRCDIQDQWRTHSILGKDSTACYTRIFSYRHFRSISTNWKYQRSRTGPFDLHLHELDNALEVAFMRAGLAPMRIRPPQLLSRLARQINPSRKQKPIEPLKQSVPVKTNGETVESNVAVLAVDANDPALGGNMIGGDPQTYHPELWSYLIERFSIQTVLDVGCGEGHCVQYCSTLGVNAVGFDGLKRNIDCAVVPIVHHDLRSAPFIMPVDLVLCCEVVEHIKEQYLPNLLRTLANGRVIAMTHAVPGQTGYHHVNLQPSIYWIKKLEALGYKFLRNETDEGKRRISASGRWTYFVSSGLVFERRQDSAVLRISGVTRRIHGRRRQSIRDINTRTVIRHDRDESQPYSHRP